MIVIAFAENGRETARRSRVPTPQWSCLSRSPNPDTLNTNRNNLP